MDEIRLLFGIALLSLCVTPPASADALGVEAKPGIEAVANPEQGPALRIARVDDRRAFRDAVADRWQPSAFQVDLEDGDSLARIIARTRDSALGGRGGNVVLADGESVAGVTRAALTQALRLAGYRVLAAGDPGFAEAAPVEADVVQFWGSLREPQGSYGSYRFEFRIAVRVSAPVPGLREGQRIEGNHTAARSGRNTIYWSSALRGALAKFAAAVRERAVRREAL